MALAAGVRTVLDGLGMYLKRAGASAAVWKSQRPRKEQETKKRDSVQKTGKLPAWKRLILTDRRRPSDALQAIAQPRVRAPHRPLKQAPLPQTCPRRRRRRPFVAHLGAPIHVDAMPEREAPRGARKPMPRFFIDSDMTPQQELALPESVVRHVQVLRLRTGDQIELFHGRGGAYAATLVALEKRRAIAHIDAHLSIERETPYRVTLVQGIASNEKMDWLIEKAVELGVSEIVPIQAERSVVRLDGERASRRLAHWRSLVVAACEQCGRNRVPHVQPPARLDAWLDTWKEVCRSTPPQESLGLWFSPQAAAGWSSLPGNAPRGPVAIAVGPEGGWSSAEEGAARAAGLGAISLGTRILRTETAALAVLAALATRWNGWL